MCPGDVWISPCMKVWNWGVQVRAPMCLDWLTLFCEPLLAHVDETQLDQDEEKVYSPTG